MKKLPSVLIAALTLFSVNAQGPKEGDVLRISPNDVLTYDHIEVPKKNFIIKRGGLAHMDQIEGAQVVISKIVVRQGKKVAILRRKDGKKFFNVYKTLTAELDGALNSGELVKP